MATMMIVAFLWGFVYLLSDVLYTVIDPRVRLAERSRL
jgi:peptide/nickel transport system permease protein